MCWWGSSPNLVIESYIHHHHLATDADPARAAGIVGVYATPEPHLDIWTSVTQKKKRLCSMAIFFKAKHHFTIWHYYATLVNKVVLQVQWKPAQI